MFEPGHDDQSVTVSVCLVACICWCLYGYNELVFGCCQSGSTHARYVFGYMRADVEPDSHDT
jgi:hypothetical protein